MLRGRITFVSKGHSSTRRRPIFVLIIRTHHIIIIERIIVRFVGRQIPRTIAFFVVRLVINRDGRERVFRFELTSFDTGSST